MFSGEQHMRTLFHSFSMRMCFGSLGYPRGADCYSIVLTCGSSPCAQFKPRSQIVGAEPESRITSSVDGMWLPSLARRHDTNREQTPTYISEQYCSAECRDGEDESSVNGKVRLERYSSLFQPRRLTYGWVLISIALSLRSTHR